jgi:predicted nucleotidyltransferase
MTLRGALGYDGMMESNTQFIIEQFARKSRKVLSENIVEEYLFGSYATQTQTPLSDIDILIIVNSLTPAMQAQLHASTTQRHCFRFWIGA